MNESILLNSMLLLLIRKVLLSSLMLLCHVVQLCLGCVTVWLFLLYRGCPAEDILQPPCWVYMCVYVLHSLCMHWHVGARVCLSVSIVCVWVGIHVCDIQNSSDVCIFVPVKAWCPRSSSSLFVVKPLVSSCRPDGQSQCKSKEEGAGQVEHHWPAEGSSCRPICQRSSQVFRLHW